MYQFTAGPDSAPYTVTTPYTRGAVANAQRETGLSREALHGALIMLNMAPDSLMGVMIVSTDGSGRGLSLTALHTQLRG